MLYPLSYGRMPCVKAGPNDYTSVTGRRYRQSMTRLDRSPFVLDFEDRFETLDDTRWLPFYLPQWSSRERTRARYEVGDHLILRIDEDQPAWAPEWDGPLRVSNLQTGVRSGPVGSGDGQLRFRDDLVVREAQRPERRYTPTSGLVEVRARAIPDPDCMVAMWLIGFGERPEHSGEICILEIFGNDLGHTKMGIHRWSDPALVERTEKVPLHFDSTEYHEYAASWRPGRTEFFVDEQLVLALDQAPEYPMQLMLDVYEFRREGEPGGAYPKEFHVEWVRGWSHAVAG